MKTSEQKLQEVEDKFDKIEQCRCREKGADGTYRHLGKGTRIQVASSRIISICGNHLQNYLIFSCYRLVEDKDATN